MPARLKKPLLRFALLLLGRLPFCIIRLLSALLAALCFQAPTSLNTLLKKNWRIAFGRLPTATEKFRVWRHFFNNTISVIKISRLTPEQYRRHVSLHPHFDTQQFLDHQRPVIALTAHLGCWEVLPRLAHCLGPGKYAALYQPLRDKHLNAWVLKTRARDGLRLIPRRNAWANSLRILKDGYCLAILADQNSGRHGIWTPFFGTLASTSPLPALLSRRTGSPIVPLFVKTLPGSKWEVQALQPIILNGIGIAEATARLNNILEQRIRQHPWDWLWFHDRWKLPNPHWLMATWAKKIFIPHDSALTPLRVVVRGMNWLGDAVMHLRAIRDIKASRPDIHLTVATIPSLAGLYRRCPFVDEVLSIPGKKSLLKTAALLRKGRYDVVVLLPNSRRVVFEARLAGIPHRAGYRVGRRNSRDITIKVPLDRLPAPGEHQAFTWQRAITYWGGRSDDSPVTLRSTAQPLPATPYGIIAPGAAYGPAKRWPPDRFAKSAQLLTAKIPHWLIVGAPSDADACASVAALLSGAENLAGKTTLEELIDLLAHADVVLSNDSGVMHLAAACAAPTVGIFGSTSPEATRPVGPCEIVYNKQPCSPCFERTCRYGHYDCLNSIHPETVAAAALRAIQNTPAKKP
jgi:heptosyltransferase-2